MKRTLAFAVGLMASVAGLSTASASDLVRVGDGPFISGGAFFIARDKGYFEKLGLKIETRSFIDGSLAVPSMISGELDIAGMTAAASLFNSVAKGAPLVIILDRGRNSPGRAYTALNVSTAIAEQGVKSAADLGKLKGKRIGVGALGSINQYNAAKLLVRAGLNPAKDVHWVTNVGQPDLMKMLGQNQVDATDLAYQFSMFAQNNKWGPIIATGDQVDAGEQIATYAVRRDFLKDHRDVVVRFAEAYLQGIKDFNAAAAAPDKHQDIVDILAKSTALNKPALVKAIAPHWSYVAPDGKPNVKSIMRMQDFWAGPYFHLVSAKVTEKQLFDLSVVKDARERLERDHPFGK